MHNAAGSMTVYLAGNVANGNIVEEDCVNGLGDVKEVRKITIDTATAGATYASILDNLPVSFVAPSGSPSTTQVATAGLNYLREDDRFFGKFTFTSVANEIFATRTLGNKTFTWSDTDAKLTTALVTAASTANVIEFCVPVVKLPGYPIGRLYKVGNITTLTKRVDNATFTYTSGEILSFRLKLASGKFIDYQYHMETSAAATKAAVITAANTAFSGYLVFSAHADANKFIITSNVYGLDYEFTGSYVTFTQVDDSLCSAGKVFGGIARRRNSFVTDTGGGFRPGVRFTALKQGEVYVNCNTNPKNGDDVYWDATNSVYTDEPSSTVYYIPNAKFAGAVSSSLAIVKLG
jgi:hypothetical protein